MKKKKKKRRNPCKLKGQRRQKSDSAIHILIVTLGKELMVFESVMPLCSCCRDDEPLLELSSAQGKRLPSHLSATNDSNVKMDFMDNTVWASSFSFADKAFCSQALFYQKNKRLSN